MAAAGREPDETHVIVDTLSADSGFRSLTILTVKGRTVEEEKGKRQKSLVSKTRKSKCK